MRRWFHPASGIYCTLFEPMHSLTGVYAQPSGCDKNVTTISEFISQCRCRNVSQDVELYSVLHVYFQVFLCVFMYSCGVASTCMHPRVTTSCIDICMGTIVSGRGKESTMIVPGGILPSMKRYERFHPAAYGVYRIQSAHSGGFACCILCADIPFNIRIFPARYKGRRSGVTG